MTSNKYPPVTDKKKSSYRHFCQTLSKLSFIKIRLWVSWGKDGTCMVSLCTRDETDKRAKSHVGFVVDKMALGQVFSEYFGFPCQSSFHQFLHNHHRLPSGAGTICQEWPQYQKSRDEGSGHRQQSVPKLCDEHTGLRMLPLHLNKCF
jgi:hypothetical protein